MSRNFLVIRLLLILMVFAVSLTGAPVFAQSGTVVRVDPSTLSAQVNDNVNLSIKVDNVANLTAIELHLSFNPSVLEVSQMTNGGFVVADFSAQNTFDNTAGTIDYAVAQMNRPAAQGNGTLLNIVFHVKTSGVSTVTLRSTQAAPTGLLLSDSNGVAIQSSWVSGSVNVGGSPTSTFTPTATPTNTPTGPTQTFTPTATPTNTSTGPTQTFTPTATLTNTPTGPTRTFTPTATPTNTNTPTVTPTPTTATSGSILGTHVVRLGEWLFCIGRAYGVSPWAIAEANGVRWWPYLIYPNQNLVIPNVPWTNMTLGPVCKSQFTLSILPIFSSTATPTVATTVIPATVIVGTISPTATPIPSSACRAVYVVRAGDTLYNIAVQYGISYSEIARVNQISNPRLIYSGQQLCIP